VPITDDIMARARRSDRSAVEAVLIDSYPAVYRMSHGLTGDARAGGIVARHVLRRAVHVMPRWRKGITPENWFYHHTLIVAREVAKTAPPPEHDLLVTAGPVGHPAYVAFVHALRGLPRQQLEAFLLNHGEKLNSRILGVAMDCSSSAAANHLAAATAALETIAGESFPSLVAAREKTYISLSPPERAVRAAVAAQAATALWRARIRRWFRRLIQLAILALIGYAVWRWHAQLLQWFELLRSRATSRPA
jgi:DNA-directed RNA polymerase specialized sigma24 family protein